MPRRLSPLLIAGFLLLLFADRLFAWDAVGHQLVARIAWDNLTETTRAKVIALLGGAPKDACLRNLFPADSRPLEVRQREFFVRASTWPDIVRPGDGDTRPCTRFHHGDWHFINYFWEGISGATNKDAPRDRSDIQMPQVNVLERLTLLRSFSERLKPAGVKAWSLEGLATTKARVYPVTLRRGRLPEEAYRVDALAISREAIALAGYRLADLLNTMYGM